MNPIIAKIRAQNSSTDSVRQSSHREDFLPSPPMAELGSSRPIIIMNVQLAALMQQMKVLTKIMHSF